jgi:drug/metabolite transporter (DMT)-like permease
VLAVGLIVAGAIFYASGITWNTTGVVLALGSAWVFAASLIFMTRALARSNVTDVALVGAFAAAAVALPVGLIVEGPDAFVFTSSEIGALALGALGAQLVPQLSRSWALAQIGPSPVGAIGVLAPVVTISLSMWLLSNPIDAGEIGGLVLIVGGALTATLAGTRGKNGTAGAHAEVLEAEPAPT